MVEVKFVETSFPSDFQARGERDGKIIGVLLDEGILGVEVDSRVFQEVGRAVARNS